MWKCCLLLSSCCDVKGANTVCDWFERPAVSSRFAQNIYIVYLRLKIMLSFYFLIVRLLVVIYNVDDYIL